MDKEFISKKIDKKLTFEILEKYNNNYFKSLNPVEIKEIPVIDNNTIIDLANFKNYVLSKDLYLKSMEDLLPGVNPESFGTITKNTISLSPVELEKIGILLYPVTVFGILNGGSATSYVDRKKNTAFNPELFDIYSAIFSSLAEFSKDKAKGITPAFTNPDGSFGPSYLVLKLRGVLIQALKYQTLTGKREKVLFPLFQMTSTYNNKQIQKYLAECENNPFLSDLISETGIPITQVQTGIQPLLAAFSPLTEGKKLELFTNAHGRKNSLLPLPGGHGQNFMVLKNIYKKLYTEGKRFAYLGNIDNTGSTIDPVSLAILALSGKSGAFDFSYKTSVDVKGGVLIRDKLSRLNCVDIGPAISISDIKKLENQGQKILFNCATGLFNLKYLVENIDTIIDSIPVRFSNQNKDAGNYSQAEQITWEIMGIMDDFLVFAVNKYDRFLAAKILVENLMTSGLELENPLFPKTIDGLDLKQLAFLMNQGLVNKLYSAYGLVQDSGKWLPKSAHQLKKEFSLEKTDL